MDRPVEIDELLSWAESLDVAEFSARGGFFGPELVAESGRARIKLRPGKFAESYKRGAHAVSFCYCEGTYGCSVMHDKWPELEREVRLWAERGGFEPCAQLTLF